MVRALKQVGQDVTAVPVYLPQILESLDATREAPIFFGGINSYLQQNYRLFRKTPRWVDRVLDTNMFLKSRPSRCRPATRRAPAATSTRKLS